MKAHDKEIRDNRQKDDTFFDPKKIGKIREIVNAQPDTVMIYPLVAENELSIQLYVRDVVKTIPVNVGRKELGKAVYEFRQLMEHCEKPGIYCGTAEISQVQAASQKLYKAQLMENFYGNLAHSKTPITKAQALRLAQLSLLYGKQVTLEDIKRGAINPEPVAGKPSQQTSTRANVSHPYYWAPFILMGNGM